MKTFARLLARCGFCLGLLGSLLAQQGLTAIAAESATKLGPSDKADASKSGSGVSSAEGAPSKKPIEGIARPQIAKPGDALAPKNAEAIQKVGEGGPRPREGGGSTKPVDNGTPAVSTTRAGRTINDVTVPESAASGGAVPAGAKGTSAKPKAREGSNPEAPTADALENRVRSLFEERLSRDGEVFLRISPDTPVGKGGLATPSAGGSVGREGSASGAAASTSRSGKESKAGASQKPGVESADSAGHNRNLEHAWDWSGPRGPQSWGRLDPANLLCAQGKMQSPPSISEAAVISSTMRMPALTMGEAGFSWKRDGPLWSVQVAANASANWREESWLLETMQFRFPGEPFVGAMAPQGSIHLIHRKEGRTLILAAPLMESSKAARHVGLTTLMKRFPMDQNDRPDWSSLRIDLRTFLPPEIASGIAFSGSLSYPPCTEGVYWILLDKPLLLPPEQLREMERLLGRGQRPVQANGPRLILRLTTLNP